MTAGNLFAQNAGSADIFVARYDSAGNQIWGRQLGTSDSEYALALAPDGAGGTFLSGPAYGSLFAANLGGEDVWLARYNPEGVLLSGHQFGTSAPDVAWTAASDGAGGVFAAGNTIGSLGGPNAGGKDAWFARFALRVYGDLDGDCQVGLSDLATLLSHFGTPSGATYADGDLDADGDVDLSDLTQLLANFGTTCP